MRFVDVKNDVAFRKIFGNEKKTKILISFLNAVLELENKDRIIQVSILNPYQLPRLVGEKATIIDISAKDQKGRQFVIEMQVADAEGFDKRVQYYTCRDYSSQIKKGDDYPLLKPTYFIGILDFNFFESPGFLSRHIIVDGKTYEHKLKDIQFTFIELKKFNKKIENITTLVEKWIYFIKNAEEMQFIPDNVEDEGLIEAYKDAEKHGWKKGELRAYDNAFIAIQDARGRLTAAEKKGMARGIAKGKAKELKDTIKRCHKAKMSVATIAQITNLTTARVEEIIKEIEMEI